MKNVARNAESTGIEASNTLTATEELISLSNDLGSDLNKLLNNLND
ncbi:MAG: hypothetical protein HRT40_01870 [Campylobacteraceae bacterium]|nr:hypothetical protein [Campylobacteraceae bacterium]